MERGITKQIATAEGIGTYVEIEGNPDQGIGTYVEIEGNPDQGNWYIRRD